MARVEIIFGTDNEAFSEDMQGEVSRVALEGAIKAASMIAANDSDERAVRDSNGNTVGFVRVTV